MITKRRLAERQLPRIDKMVDAAVTYFAPIVVFLLVFIIIFATLNKTKVLGTNKWVQVFVGLFIASLFVSFSGAREYAVTVVPWVAVLIISLFFVLLLMAFVGKPLEGMTRGVGVTFFVILIIVLIVSAFVVFNHVIGPYMPWGSGGPDPDATRVTGFIYSWRIVGSIILIVISALVAWILTKK